MFSTLIKHRFMTSQSAQGPIYIIMCYTVIVLLFN